MVITPCKVHPLPQPSIMPSPIESVQCHVIDPLLKGKEYLVMLKQSIDQGFGMKHRIDREGGGDKDPTEFGQLGMGDFRIKFPGKTFVTRFREGVAFVL